MKEGILVRDSLISVIKSVTGDELTVVINQVFAVQPPWIVMSAKLRISPEIGLDDRMIA